MTAASTEARVQALMDQIQLYTQTFALSLAHTTPKNLEELGRDYKKLESALRQELSGKDAERYQMLRRGQKWSVIDGIGNVLRAEELDAAIDAAIQSTTKETT